MAKLKISDVEHIAKLSRLTLSQTEKERFANQLSDVLEYVGQLNEVDTTNVDPTAQVTGLDNIYVNDLVTNPEGDSELLSNSPEKEKTFIKIPAVFE